MIEFYKFSSSSSSWLFTSSKQPVTYLSEVYIPNGISRGKISGQEDVSTSNLEISASLNDTFFQMCDSSDLEEKINVTVYSKDETGDVSIIFNGILTKCAPNETNYKLTFSSVFSQQGRAGVGVQVQGSCSFMLYDYGCFKNKNDMKLTGTITTIANNVLTMAVAATKPDGWFAGGFIENADGAPRFILKHVGNQLTLTKALTGLNTTDSFDIFAGCDRSPLACHDKFDNMDNFGGRPQMPRINPYTIIMSM